jgi:NAD(P)-dependent dehydrogenase (short-subunit alcohol dehydrogenase family)
MEEGCNVVLTGRDEGRGRAAIDELQRAGPGAVVFIGADLSQEEEVERLITEAQEHFGGIDILVNNAAPIDLIRDGRDGDIRTVTTASLDQMLKVGLYGTFWCCKYAIPSLMEGGGAIVNVSSIAGFRAKRHTPVYSLMKGAINALTVQLAVDVAPTVRVNGVVPAATTGTSTVDAVLTKDNDIAKGWRDMTLTRLANVSDVAAAVAFLASDDSGATTGCFIFTEGGQHIWSRSPDLSTEFENHHADR